MYGHPSALNAMAAALAPQTESVGVALQFQSGGTVPDWIELVPAGEFQGRDGRRFVNDRPDQVVAAFTANRATLPFDIEHSSEHKAAKGDPAPAQGWIEELQVRSGAIWSRVEWNPSGRELIANRQYRYYSPVFYFDQKTQQVLALKSAGLTNQPNLFFAALNRATTTQETDMDFTKIALALGLIAAAGETDILQAINALKDERATALNRAETPDPAKWVPQETHALALNRATTAETSLASLKQAALDADIEVAINSAQDAGKIAPANKDYYTAMCRTEGGLEKFKAFAATAPALISDQGKDTKRDPGTNATALNAEEAQVAKLLGISTADFAAARTAAAA
ncbi:MAG: phage protease [Halioglobus sp.]